MKITFPNGEVREYPEGTKAIDIARSISERLANEALGAFFNGEKIDLSREITSDGTIRFVTFDDPEGKEIYWHSSAHLMAEAIQELYPGVKFGVGPAIEWGFYYDVALPNGQKLTNEDLPKIEQKMLELAKRNAEYERIEISWEDAVEHFKKVGDEYKLELLEGLKGEKITFYKQGNFIDLCRGTHIPNTSKIKYVKLLNVAGAYWRGDSSRNMMTRIYGITFPKKSMMDEYLKMLEEAKKRDHRKLGRELELFLITPAVGGGLPIWLPKGAIIRRVLEDFLRKEHYRRGYVEVITPHIGNLELYKTSGHYPYYKDSQYPPMKVEDEEYILKPMNCPHHHQIYLSKPRSYRDLPLRLFEFGTVYRYEQSGELTGLTRVRGFTQDDAHIYCTVEQLKDEIKGVVDLMQFFFGLFKLEFTTRLSFRDEDTTKYGGNMELWDRAQREIKEVADEINLEYVIAEGEAAFYGPKIDFIVKDAIGRKWQLGTVQVDYVMPERFQLEYIGADNQPHRPVIIHRAPAGSLERFLSILIEHFAGNFPFWIAPVQVSVLPIGEEQHTFAKELSQKLENLGFRVNLDLRNERINKKIAESETQKIPFALIIGKKEAEKQTVSVRRHTKGDMGEKSIDEVIALFNELNQPGVIE
ncbi:MAG: Threonyl-tRNA synthetase [Candidatus Kapaibacterium sp.]|jgi:threonyl-tRNA synthetase|nr:MAG: Threonyl-tRNA synthetase [Candidatus Kapabacteria bacterium]ROL55896.1 MAG: threonine--tRNA ligase [Bacteroidetes/Chlorobi group bacterium Naka2016]